MGLSFLGDMALSTGPSTFRLSGVLGLGNAEGTDTTRFNLSGTAEANTLSEGPGAPIIVFERGRDVDAKVETEVEGDKEDVDAEAGEDVEGMRCSIVGAGRVALAATSFV